KTLANWATTGMAHASGSFEQRIRSILDHARERHPASRALRTMAFGIMCLAVVSVAALRPSVSWAASPASSRASAQAPDVSWMWRLDGSEEMLTIRQTTASRMIDRMTANGVETTTLTFDALPSRHVVTERSVGSGQ